MNGPGHSLGIRNYNGGIEIRNMTDDSPCSIDMNSGHLKIASSCTAGTISARGVFKLTDNSNGTTVDTDGRAPDVPTARAIIESATHGDLTIDPVNNTLTVYDKDTGAVISVFNLFDENNNPSSTKVFRREVQ